MSKSQRDRSAYYLRNTAIHPIFAESASKIHEDTVVKNGRNLFTKDTLPKDVKDFDQADRNPYGLKRASSNDRKSQALLKKKMRKIKRSQNKQQMHKEMKNNQSD